MKLQNLPIGQIHANEGQIKGLPENPRYIRDTRFEKLKQSIADAPEMLQMRSLIVVAFQGEYVVICGNMRLRACLELGTFPTLPCFVLPKETPVEKLREYTIKDNIGFGENDWDALANDWDALELEEWGIDPLDWENFAGGDQSQEGEESAEEDDFTEEDEEKAPPRVQAGEIWQLGDHRLMCGDSTEAEQMARLMDGEQADLCVTDPPYNVDYGGKVQALKKLGYQNEARESDDIANDNMADASFYAFLLDSHRNMMDVCRAGAVVYVFHADTNGLLFRQAYREAGFKLSQCLIWEKNTFVLGRQDYQWKHEPILYGWKEGAAHYFVDDHSQDTIMAEDDINIDAMKKAELLDYLKRMLDLYRDKTTILHENKPLRNDIHPTMKPVRLVGRLMANSSQRGWAVLDPFGGGGTTIIAAEQLGRRCYMMELDPHYCDVIIARWEKFTGQIATKVETTPSPSQTATIAPKLPRVSENASKADNHTTTKKKTRQTKNSK